jgi:hypothetical protein
VWNRSKTSKARPDRGRTGPRRPETAAATRTVVVGPDPPRGDAGSAVDTPPAERHDGTPAPQRPGAEPH